MKTQYLGDKRDLFKYDLLTRISKQIKSLKRITFITMLTPNESQEKKKNEGNKRNLDEKVGHKNGELISTLKNIKI